MGKMGFQPWVLRKKNKKAMEIWPWVLRKNNKKNQEILGCGIVVEIFREKQCNPLGIFWVFLSLFPKKISRFALVGD